MLNSEGGIILIGVDDEGNVVGVDDKRLMEKLTAALQAIEPAPKVEIKEFDLDGKRIVAIKVNKSDKLHAYRGRVFIRVGASNRPLSVLEIVEKAAESLLITFDEMPSKAPLDAINKDYVRISEEKRGNKRDYGKRQSPRKHD